MTNGRRWYWLTIALIAGLLAVYADRRDLYGVYKRYKDSEEQVRILERRIDDMQAREAELQRRVQDLHGDPLEMEAAVRRGKNLVREGETIYRVELPGDAPE